MDTGESKDTWAEAREAMVAEQIEARGVSDERVLNAMRSVPRHLFVPSARRNRAYDDTPLPLGEGQTISQPYIVAWMTELLEVAEGDTVLEVGTGSGYQAAILGVLAREVYTIERIGSLARSARDLLERLGFENVEVVEGDGSRGLEEHAPYDEILVAAGSPGIPDALVKQLKDGGRMVIPVGPSTMQMLMLVEKQGSRVKSREVGSCVFVPLLGTYGWKPL